LTIKEVWWGLLAGLRKIDKQGDDEVLGVDMRRSFLSFYAMTQDVLDLVVGKIGGMLAHQAIIAGAVWGG
jgi:hypothetical protein